MLSLSNKAGRFALFLKTFLFGLPTGKGMEFIPLVDFIFETNPLHKTDIDQCITAVCQPLEIIYDAVSWLTLSYYLSLTMPKEANVAAFFGDMSFV